MSDAYILDDDGNLQPVDVLTWARWLEEDGRRRIMKREEVGDLLVSTVFLGLDHSFGDGVPLLFETMVFGVGHDECFRYASKAAALSGHDEVVRRLEAGESLDDWAPPEMLAIGMDPPQ